LRRSLERSDTLISLRNKEIAALNSRLAAKDETIAELDEHIGKLDSELETERADREKLEAELSDLRQKSATAGKDLPDVAEVYNQFKAKNPKTKISYKEAEAILVIAQAMIEES